MKWIVGLGNPGRQYAKTRHNVGFMAVDRFADHLGIKMKDNKSFRAFIGEGQAQGHKVVLIKPQTFMNLSGEAVRAFRDFYKADVEQLIVLYDDLDTEFGKLRLRYKGSAGGHNGMKSLIQHLGTEQFKRIRLGISRPPVGYGVTDYVLSKFARKEREVLDRMLDDACRALHDALEHPFDKVMAKYN